MTLTQNHKRFVITAAGIIVAVIAALLFLQAYRSFLGARLLPVPALSQTIVGGRLAGATLPAGYHMLQFRAKATDGKTLGDVVVFHVGPVASPTPSPSASTPTPTVTPTPSSTSSPTPGPSTPTPTAPQFWQSPNNKFDVNGDGQVSPIDLVLVINLSNSTGPIDQFKTTVSKPPYYDVNGDKEFSAIDLQLESQCVSNGAC